MPLATIARRFGNNLYRFAFPIYRPLYSVFKRHADRAEREFLARNLSDGSVAVDAGANIGIYSKFLAQCVGRSGIVHSFEPDPNNFSRLHAALSPLPNVRLNQLAVGDEAGESVLYISEELNVDHRAYPTEGELRETISIRSITLDGYFPPGERVDLIKVDIQGYELHALRGAERVLADNPAVLLLLEFWPYGLKQAGGSGEELVSFLQERQFLLYVPAKGGLKQYREPVEGTEAPANYFNLFARRER